MKNKNIFNIILFNKLTSINEIPSKEKKIYILLSKTVSNISFLLGEPSSKHIILSTFSFFLIQL